MMPAAASTEAPEFLMPVSEEHALRQFEIQALQRINDNLRLLNEGQQQLVNGMHNIDIRLTRIEASGDGEELDKVRAEVALLKTEKNQRDGAVNLATWIFRNWPGILGFVGMLLVILKSMGKI